MALVFGVVPPQSPRASSISSNLLQNWTPIGAETPELPGNISPFISSFEVQGHFTVGQTARALELIRRSWGWYANNPYGTESTVVEGYLVNGTFGYRSSRGYDYDASYVSHSHGWGSGPTSALTTFVLGLSVTGRAGSTWRLAPQFGDLERVEGGFVSGLGKFQAAWRNDNSSYSMNLTTPAGTIGQVVLPVLAQGLVPSVVLDGEAVSALVVANNAVNMKVEGGTHTIVVS